jgi:hypothetical protein
MGRPIVARRCLWVACVVGCAAGTPVPRLKGVSPLAAYNDRALRMDVYGEGFIPSYRLDPSHDARRGDASGFSGWVGSGTDEAARAALYDFDWLDTGHMTAWMREGLPAGLQSVQIRDPRGQTVTLFDVFTGLGPDRDQPTIQFVRPPPNALLAPGMTVEVTVFAIDTAPGALGELSWETYAGNDRIEGRSCALVPTPGVTCHFDVSVPISLGGGDVFEIRAAAFDRALVPNRTPAVLSFVLHARPALEDVRPAEGGTAGGTDVVVSGSGLIPGVRVLVDGVPLLPDGGTLVDDQTISGRMPAHAAGVATLTLESPLGASKLAEGFVYAEPPAIASIMPSQGDPIGGTPVTVVGERFGEDTQVLFGETLATAQPLSAPQWVSDTEIRGIAPPGTGRTTVWVFDATLGSSKLVDGFGWRVP